MAQPNWRAVRLEEAAPALVIIDQTRLPNTFAELRLQSLAEIRAAICALQVRGAPAIGIAAAYGLALTGLWSKAETTPQLLQELREARDYLAAARPTAVNLQWALDRVLAAAAPHLPADQIRTCLLAAARQIEAEDEELCRKIGEAGLALLRPGDGVLTHCNAGQLATSRYGTALAPLYLAAERGLPLRLYCDETRPLLQGARLTAWEMQAAGIDTTLVCDNMAADLMARGQIDKVFVGCDRVAQNGDTANKIGTLSVAVLAHHFGVPFYVCAPASTLDGGCPNGAAIPVEQRDAEEVRSLWYAEPQAPPAVKIYNPAFDITPAALITAFITERGVIRPPYAFA